MFGKLHEKLLPSIVSHFRGEADMSIPSFFFVVDADDEVTRGIAGRSRPPCSMLAFSGCSRAIAEHGSAPIIPNNTRQPNANHDRDRPRTTLLLCRLFIDILSEQCIPKLRINHAAIPIKGGKRALSELPYLLREYIQRSARTYSYSDGDYIWQSSH